MERLKRPSTVSGELVQRKESGPAFRGIAPVLASTPPPLQARGSDPVRAGAWEADAGLMSAMGIHQAAAQGVSGTATSLPHADAIQQSFGSAHDVSSVQAHVGGNAAAACDTIGASAYATGNSVAFKSAPDLHTAAHEAAHVVQQRKGVSLYGGVGEAGDVHEQHADAVADRVVRGESAADLLSTGSGGGGGGDAVIQREEAGKPPTAGADKKDEHKTVNLELRARFEEIAGTAKDKTAEAKTGENSMWLDPITYAATNPSSTTTVRQLGVVTHGVPIVDTFAAPVTSGDKQVGRGAISAQVKYAAKHAASYDVKVMDVPAGPAMTAATNLAKQSIHTSLEGNGDVEEAEKTATAVVAAKFPGATVKVSTKTDKLNKPSDAGETTFYYKLRSNGRIEMFIKPAPIGGKKVDWDGKVVKDEGEMTEVEKKQKLVDEKIQKKTVASETETNEAQHATKVVKTIDGYVEKATVTRTEVASQLAKIVVADGTAQTKGVEQHHDSANIEYEDHTEGKSSSEEGDKDTKNWAQKLKEGVELIEEATDIPFIKNVPLVGPLARKVNGWKLGLDVVGKGLGIFAEKGKVHYKDFKQDESQKGNVTFKDDGGSTIKVDSTAHSEEETRARLKQDFLSKTETKWKKHMDEVTTTRSTYYSKMTRESQAEVDIHKQKFEDSLKEKVTTKKNQTTTNGFSGQTTWTFTRPIVEATVIGGDVEVSSKPLPADPGEQDQAAAPTK